MSQEKLDFLEPDWATETKDTLENKAKHRKCERRKKRKGTGRGRRNSERKTRQNRSTYDTCRIKHEKRMKIDFW